MKFAETTTVSAEKSKMEIERILTRYGANSFASGWQGSTAAIIFEMNQRRIKFLLPLPDPTAREFTALRKGSYSDAPAGVAKERYEQSIRQRWRALALAIKAKLEAVESGITTFEEEFLAHVVLPNGSTVGQWMGPQIEQSYKSKAMPPLLIGSGT